MKKHILFLIILTFYYSIFSQEDPQYTHYMYNMTIEMPFDSISCEKAKMRAVEDFKNGKYNSNANWLSAIRNRKFHKFYSDFIKNKYNITFNKSSDLGSFSNCYPNKMRKLILRKFGNNIFIKSRNEAIEEYKKTTFFIENIKPKIVTNKIFEGIVLEPSEYIFGRDSLRTYIRSKLFDFKDDKGYIVVNFIVEKDGTMSDVKVDKFKQMDSIANEKAVKYIKLLKKWKPAKHFGVIVRVRKSLFFNLENKKYYTKNGKERKKKIKTCGNNQYKQ